MTTPMAPLPRYLQIAESLSRDIGSGRFGAGDRLPTERQLAAQFEVTVITLRKALAVLADRGLVDRRHGSGTYVTGESDRVGAYALFRLERNPQGGGLPTADLLSLTRSEATPDFPDAPHVWVIRRLRRLDGVPVALEQIQLHGRYANHLTEAELSESLYHSYRRALGLEITRAEDRIGLSAPPDWGPNTLTNGEITQMGLVDRQAFDGYGRLAEVSTTWFDPARARYVARIP